MTGDCLRKDVKEGEVVVELGVDCTTFAGIGWCIRKVFLGCVSDSECASLYYEPTGNLRDINLPLAFECTIVPLWLTFRYSPTGLALT